MCQQQGVVRIDILAFVWGRWMLVLLYRILRIHYYTAYNDDIAFEW